MDAKQWFTEVTKRRVTDQEVAEILGVTRKTANKRLNEGLSADDLIALCSKWGINKTLALVDFEHISYQDVLDYLDSDGALVATAEDGELALELARRLNPATKAGEINKLEQARSRKHPHVDPEDGIVREWDGSIPHAADSSPDEDALREERGEDLID